MPLVAAEHLIPTPGHVSRDLSRPFPYVLGSRTKLATHSFIEAMHRGPDVFWAERAFNGVQGAWVPRSVELMQRVYEDSEHYSARGFAPFAKMLGDSWFLVPAEADPPLHTLLRQMVAPVFTPVKMAQLEDKIREYAREYICRFKDRGGCEFLADFAFEFPIRVFLELMGLPQERTTQFLAWEHSLLHEPDLQTIIEASRAVVEYLQQEIDARRSAPRDDLISFGLQVNKNGRGLTDDELMGFCFNLFIGGLDTVSTNMAWQFHHLAERHDHQATLRANPGMIPHAIDEMMRYYAAVATSRECIKETKLGDVTVKPGDKILLATFLGGHDPAAFKDPEQVILDRGPRHVSFGYGPHLCIGMHLARREMRIALEEFLSLIPEFSLAPDADIAYYLAAIIQPIQLPLVWAA